MTQEKWHARHHGKKWPFMAPGGPLWCESSKREIPCPHLPCRWRSRLVPTRAFGTLRSNGHIVETGDLRLSVRYHCGEPLLQDSYCAPVYYSPGFQRVPEPFASSVVPCLMVDEWLYDRCPGNLAATVRFRAGVVQSITYGARATP